jgi:hypothetical protein
MKEYDIKNLRHKERRQAKQEVNRISCIKHQ